MTAVMEMLTEDQRAKWETLIGKRLQTERLLKASFQHGVIAGMPGVIGNILPALPIAPPPPPPEPKP